VLAGNSYQALNITAEWMLSFYKKFISPLQGGNICNFFPTCSQFSQQAINDYGVLVGLLMTSDRLLRCNPSAWQYLDQYYSNLKDGKIFDPPENHYIASDYMRKPDSAKASNFNLNENSKKLLLESASVQNFADYLFNSGDFMRAAADYKRLFFLADDIRVKRYAQMMLGESYLANNEFESALAVFSDNNDTSLLSLNKYGQARSYLNISEYQKARQILSQVKDSNLTRLSQILIGWSYFKEKSFESGAASFNPFTDDSTLITLTKFNSRNLSQRSRLLSACLSAVIPGTGQIYSGRLGDGLYSFLTIATSAGISYYYWKKDESKIKFSIFAFLTGLFWAGNVYGANIAARDYNQYQIRKYLAKIDRILTRIDLMPDYHFLLTE